VRFALLEGQRLPQAGSAPLEAFTPPRAGSASLEVSTLPLNKVRLARGLGTVGVLDQQTYQGGTRGSRLCGEDRDRETENSKVCARTRDTRFIQVRAAKVANPTSCLGDQVWRPALGVG
jgi:hypothetical protein